MQCRPEEPAQLLRVLSRQSVCVLLRNGPGAVVQADLRAPLSPRSYCASQAVNALNSLPAKVCLGVFEADTCKFLDCTLDVDFPDPAWTRVNYADRKKRL